MKIKSICVLLTISMVALGTSVLARGFAGPSIGGAGVGEFPGGGGPSFGGGPGIGRSIGGAGVGEFGAGSGAVQHQSPFGGELPAQRGELSGRAGEFGAGSGYAPRRNSELGPGSGLFGFKSIQPETPAGSFADRPFPIRPH